MCTPEDTRYAFCVVWEDTQAQLTRPYELFYYAIDGTVEMFDLKSRRMFVKRMACPSVELKDLFVGNSVTVLSRLLKIKSFADKFTENALGRKQVSVVVVCPFSTYENLGKVLDAAYSARFVVANLKMFRVHDAREVDAVFGSEKWSNLRSVTQDLAAGAFVAFEVIADHPVQQLHELSQSNPQVFEGVLWSTSSDLAKQQALALFGSSRLPGSAQLNNCTVCVIKPHAVAKGIPGKIIDLILDEGYEISAMELLHLDKESSSDFLEVYKGVVPEYNALASELSTGPCIALEIRGESTVVDKFRALCGPHVPEVARALYPESLRARFGEDRIKNAVHCTDLAEDGILEAQYFFSLLQEA